MSTCTNLTAYKGRGAVSIALRNTDGTLGQWFPVAESRRLEVTNTQDFEDQYSRCDRVGGNIIHALQQTDYEVAIDTYDFSPDSLARAYYGTVSTVAAGSAVNEALVFTAVGETMPLANPFGVTAISAESNTATALVEDVDYSVDLEHGTITLLDATNFTGSVPGQMDVDYSFIEYDKVESGLTGVKEYAVRFDGINVLDNMPYQVFMWRIAMNLSASLSLITEDTASLEMTGKLLADTTRPAGESQYWVAKIGKVAV